MVLQAWYCYTNDAFKFFTNQKLAIKDFQKRILRKGWSAQSAVLVSIVMLREFYFLKKEIKSRIELCVKILNFHACRFMVNKYGFSR